MNMKEYYMLSVKNMLKHTVNNKTMQLNDTEMKIPEITKVKKLLIEAIKTCSAAVEKYRTKITEQEIKDLKNHIEKGE